MGWKSATIGDVAEVQAGSGFPTSYQGKNKGKYPFVKVGDISEAFIYSNRILSKANNFITEQERDELGAKVFPIDSILFAKIGEALKLNRRVINCVPVCADNNVMGLIPIEDCNPRYIFHYMRP
jgi:type I restriction enzyme S subunit